MVWRVVITITYTSDGLKVSAAEPHHETTGAQIELSTQDPYNAKTFLEDKIVTLAEEAVKAIADHFSENDIYKWFDLDAQDYQLFNPIFTRGGDLVYEVFATSQGTFLYHVMLHRPR